MAAATYLRIHDPVSLGEVSFLGMLDNSLLLREARGIFTL